jgi:signal transduction histidine kinase
LRRRGADDDTGEDLAPQPVLADLPSLVEQIRTVGVPVWLAVDGDPRALPEAIELSAYRIVQEALTNAVKHAAGSPVRVRLCYRPDALELEVSDEGSPAQDRSELSGGHGLVGMRERVAMYGGTLTAGPQDQGGFAVHVFLPVRGLQ